MTSCFVQPALPRAALGVLLLLGLAACQTSGGYSETRSGSYTVETGGRIEVGSYYEIRLADCSNLPLPEIAVTQPPRHGSLVFEEVSRRPRQANCAHLEVPSLRAVYEAGATPAADDFAYTVAYRSANLGTWLVQGEVAVAGESPYSAAVPQLEQAGGSRVCVSCFLERYAPAEFNKAFAVSSDGAFGGRWSQGITIEQAREEALANCRAKPEYDAANPCVVFFENDRLVWAP